MALLPILNQTARLLVPLEPVTVNIPTGAVYLNGHAPSVFVSGAAANRTSESPAFLYGRARKKNNILVVAPTGKVRLLGYRPSLYATQNAKIFGQTGTMKTRLSAGQVKVSRNVFVTTQTRKLVARAEQTDILVKRNSLAEDELLVLALCH